jgi:nitrite reductase/ring-hydroxylating ferredoxin subunit
MQAALLLLLLAASATSFKRLPQRARTSGDTALSALTQVATTSEIKNGERKLFESPSGTVIIANLDGAFFAVNAKCPHLNLPMKKGSIGMSGGSPTITCNFHNSVFDLNDGSCKEWCTGVLGIPNSGMFGNIMGAVGGAKNSPATTYLVTVSEGKVYIDI